MKVYGINCSPRKNNNTATMIYSAVNGAASEGAETEIIHLTDLDFSGCQSCFACKVIGGTHFGKCALHDELSPVLKKIIVSDALIIGSPIYFGDVTSTARAFTERLLYPNCLYSTSGDKAYKKSIPTGLIYTMNNMDADEYKDSLAILEVFYCRYFGPTMTVFATNTYQFEYKKHSSSKFDEKKKRLHRDEIFPKECKKAYNMGRELILFAKQKLAF